MSAGRRSSRWIAALCVAATAVSGGLSACSKNGSESGQQSQSDNADKPSVMPSKPVTGAAGQLPTLSDYIEQNNITETPAKQDDPGVPKIELPMPPGWVDAGGDTPTYADQAIVGADPALQPDPEFFDTYHREVSHRGSNHARSRLDGAAQRAAMIRDGIAVLRTAANPVPAADLEIDCDIEWSAEGLVYLWGARVRIAGDESSAVFVPFADWSVRDATAERALAERFADWVRGLRDSAALAGRRVRVYHWSPAESSRLHRILGSAADDLLNPQTGVFTDLEEVFNANFLSVHGSSIKVVAPVFGFTWSAHDAGGALSQTHPETVQSGHPAGEDSRNWLLFYNADDTAALAAIRDGMNSGRRVFGSQPVKAAS